MSHSVTCGFGQLMEFRTPDNGATKEERLQLVRCATLDSRFLVWHGGVPGGVDGSPRMGDVHGQSRTQQRVMQVRDGGGTGKCAGGQGYAESIFELN